MEPRKVSPEVIEALLSKLRFESLPPPDWEMDLFLSNLWEGMRLGLLTDAQAAQALRERMGAP